MSKLLKLVNDDFGVVQKGTGKWYMAIAHDSLIIDSEKDIFYWNSKEIYGGPLEYLLYVRKLPYNTALHLLSNIDNIEPSPYINSKLYDKETVVYDKLADIFWENGQIRRKYWWDRLLTNKTIDLFKLGYYDGWYTVPVYIDGKLVNIQKRRDEPEKLIRPWYSKPPTLYNQSILSVVNSVFLTEGMIDCILLNQLGIPAISKMTGATGWNPEWSKFFISIEPIYIIFDNDDSGRYGAKRVAEYLGVYKCKIYTFDGFREKYDIIDFFRDKNTIQDFKELIAEKSKYSFQI